MEDEDLDSPKETNPEPGISDAPSPSPRARDQRGYKRKAVRAESITTEQETLYLALLRTGSSEAEAARMMNVKVQVWRRRMMLSDEFRSAVFSSLDNAAALSRSVILSKIKERISKGEASAFDVRLFIKNFPEMGLVDPDEDLISGVRAGMEIGIIGALAGLRKLADEGLAAMPLLPGSDQPMIPSSGLLAMPKRVKSRPVKDGDNGNGNGESD